MPPGTVPPETNDPSPPGARAPRPCPPAAGLARVVPTKSGSGEGLDLDQPDPATVYLHFEFHSNQCGCGVATSGALHAFLKTTASSVRDLAPIVLVIALFQLLVLQQPLPDALSLLGGTACVVLGLTLFVYGLDMGLFPLGDAMAHALARKGSVAWLVAFAFALGFSTTIAEPALIAVAGQAARAAATAGVIADLEAERRAYAFGLRLTVAFSVGFAIVLGVIRIVKGWPLHLMMIGGYLVVVIMTWFAPQEIIGIAYDSGGVTTSTITVPLVTALGIGLASSIRGRSPMSDGFGLIAFASLTPMVFVMAYGMAF